MRKGFTLIELLVVIAIIGLLASIVTVSLSSSQDRAKQAKIESFAAQVHHALAADAVGIWDFDDAAAGTANDTSGLKNNGVFPGGFNKPTSSTDRYENANRAYLFDGGDYIGLGTNNLLRNTSQATMSMWVLKNSTAATIRVPLFIGTGAVGYTRAGIAFDVAEKIRVGGRAENTESFQSVTTTATFLNNKWYHVVGVINYATDSITVYVDGVIQLTTVSAPPSGVINFTASVTSDVNPSYAALGMSGSPPGGEFFNGKIDDVRVYKSALSSAQIQQLYAEGLGEHSLTQNNQ